MTSGTSVPFSPPIPNSTAAHISENIIRHDFPRIAVSRIDVSSSLVVGLVYDIEAVDTSDKYPVGPG